MLPFFARPPGKEFACKRRRHHPSPLGARSARKFSPEALFKQNSCDLRAVCGGQKSLVGSVGGWCNTGCKEAGQPPQVQQHRAAARDQQSAPRAQRAQGVGGTRSRRLPERRISMRSGGTPPLPLGRNDRLVEPVTMAWSPSWTDVGVRDVWHGQAATCVVEAAGSLVFNVEKDSDVDER